MFGDAAELSRGEELGERNRLGDVATAFGQLTGDVASGSGQLASSFLGQANQASGTAGQLGGALGNLGESAANRLVQSLGLAGDLDLRERGLLSDLQQAEIDTQLAGLGFANQGISNFRADKFNRLLGIRNFKLQEELQREFLELQEKLADAASNQGGGFLGIG